jgi:glucose-6-phosphate isomerase
MRSTPFTFDIALPGGVPTVYDGTDVLIRIVRPLSAMRGQYADQEAYEALLAQGDAVLYEVYEMRRPQVADGYIEAADEYIEVADEYVGLGELLHGTSIVHPGKVGDEYFMTKGHFHSVLDTAEVYYVLQGRGMMVMETPEEEWAVEELRPGRVLYVPPRWAHRSVNTGQEDLVTLFVYPGHAGHDYGTIETRGFRKLVIERDGQPTIVDNPRWRSQE